MTRERRNNLLRVLLGAGLYALDPLREQVASRLDDIKERARDRYDRAEDRVSTLADRLRGRESHLWNNAAWMLAGVGVGVGMGMLLAPASGEETRTRINDKVQRMSDQVRERMSPESRTSRPASSSYGT
ncbi:MAG TPA: YtxH domain-containing protein [Terriglobales bacterium]|jgi:hypothetical protein